MCCIMNSWSRPAVYTALACNVFYSEILLYWHAYAKQLAHLYVSEVVKTAEGYEDGFFILIWQFYLTTAELKF